MPEYTEYLDKILDDKVVKNIVVFLSYDIRKHFRKPMQCCASQQPGYE